MLHAHFQPPQTPAETGGVLFWIETSDVPEPMPQRGRVSQNPKPKLHPYNTAPNFKGRKQKIILRLPAARGVPLPSPFLTHHWNVDINAVHNLAPFIVEGVWMPPDEALPILLAYSTSQPDTNVSYSPASDFLYWSKAAALVLETLVAHKLVPSLVLTDNEKTAHAKWLPVLDEPRDAARLTLLEGAMPAVCRAEIFPPNGKEAKAKIETVQSPHALLTSFLHTFCDSLARIWGRTVFPNFHKDDDSLVTRWLEALISESPIIKASSAQIQSLAASHRAWMRNLHVAGDAAFRITFRLEAPALQNEAWLLHYLLQSKDDLSLLIPAEEVWKKTKSTITHLGHRFEQPQEKLLAGLGYAARIFPPIANSLKNKRPTKLTIDTNGAYNFLRESAALLEGAGFGILVPPWWNKKGARLGLKVKMQSKKGQDAITSGKMSLENLVNYEWQLSLGETELTEDEFKALAKLKSPLVQIRGHWVTLDANQIEAAINFWEKKKIQGEMSLLEAAELGLGSEKSLGGLPIDEIISDGWLTEWLEQFSQSKKLEELPQPELLHGQLRPYQGYGYSWLAFLWQWGFGACLADDMGLGKTIQAISLILHQKEKLGELSAPVLLIAPTSVVTNWQQEIGKFAPGLQTYVHRGGSRLKGEKMRKAIKDTDVVLTSYPVVRLDAEFMQSIKWLAVILDEAQNIKNPTAKQTQVIRKLHANFRAALTGTPVENRLSELWSIMHFLNPGYLGTRKAFRENFSLPIERFHDEDVVKQLRQLTTPFILRREKTDPNVITDLPDKVETKVYCNLTEEQATLYEAVVQDTMRQIEEENGIQRRGLVLSMLMQLKQICNHPIQYLHQAEKEIARVEMEGRSGKLERLGELLEEVLAAGDRALIFTQFAEMGKMLTGYLPQAFGARTQFLHGGTSSKARDQMVKRFQEDNLAPPVFILSLKAGGTGLNLTNANHVFHYDRWWNPAVEDQATDRAFRIGQTRNVQVHKFVTIGTLEEAINDMIESKKGLAKAVVGSGESWITELSTDELRRLVTLRKQ